MRLRQDFVFIFLALLTAIAGLAIVLYSVEPPTRTEMRAELERRIEELVPRDARACGLVSLHHDSSEERACVDSAMKEGRPFWAASQTPFDDSDAWLVVFAQSGGPIEAVMLDSSPTGAPIHEAKYHELERVSCRTLKLSMDAWPPIDCVFDDDAPQSATTVPIELINNFPVIEVSIGDQRIPVMFDLGGSDQIVLSSKALTDLQVEPLDETYAWVDAKGNRLESRRFRVPELRIGTLALRGVDGHEDAEAATYRKTPSGDGYVGPDLVRKFKLVVDYGHKTMTFIPHDQPDAGQFGCHGTEVPFDAGWNDDPVTRVTTDLGELLFVWDTGAPVSIIRESLIKGRGLKPDGLFFRSNKFALGLTDFGPLDLRLFEFAEPAGVDGYVGYSFFARNVVCVDFPGRRFLVRPNA